MRNTTRNGKLFDATNFKIWLLKQPLNRQFHYYNIKNCLFATFFLEAENCKKVLAGGTDVETEHGYTDIPYQFARIISSKELPTTFTINDVKDKFLALYDPSL